MTWTSHAKLDKHLAWNVHTAIQLFNFRFMGKQLDSNRRIENLDNWASGHSGPSGIYRLKHEIWTWKKDPGNKQIAMEQ